MPLLSTIRPCYLTVHFTFFKRKTTFLHGEKKSLEIFCFTWSSRNLISFLIPRTRKTTVGFNLLLAGTTGW